MNTLFKTNKKIRIGVCDRSIYKSMRIAVDIHKTNEKFSVIVQPKKHVNWNLKIIYGYHFLTKLSLTF